jgi:cobalt/nickel transport protein
VRSEFSRMALGAVALLASSPLVRAHYHILTLDKPSIAKDETVTCTLRFGHPFENQMFAAQKPTHVSVRMPDGTTADLLAKLQRKESTTPDGKPIVSFEWKFTPTQRGDHIFSVQTAPVWMGEENVFLHDTVKVTLHVQTQVGWESAAGLPFELAPLTRPYGLRAGMVFQALVQSADGDDVRLLPRTLVEIERLNPSPPKELPPDEHITRTVRSDPKGVATSTLTEPGWWAMTAVRDGGLRDRAGRAYPVVERSTLWVFVDDKVPLAPVK